MLLNTEFSFWKEVAHHIPLLTYKVKNEVSGAHKHPIKYDSLSSFSTLPIVTNTDNFMLDFNCKSEQLVLDMARLHLRISHFTQ